MRAPIFGTGVLSGLVLCQSDVIAFVQLVRSERNDAISRIDVADDQSSFVAQAGNLYGTPRNLRRLPLYQPNAGALARIEDCA